MFAVIKTGGKQYKVQSGDVLRVEKLAADAGEKVQFNDILMLGGDSPRLGTPLVAGAAVQAEVLDQIKGEKVIHFVKRRRKHGSQRTKGHRQLLTVLRVTDILTEGAEKSGVRVATGKGAAGSGDGRYAMNRSEQSEMKKRVAEGEAEAKSAKPAKAAKAETAAAGDDLKKLSGVGPALEKKLHAAGITSFAQIAAWTEDDVAKIDEQLSFKGRIQREGWIEQAREMTAK